MPARKTPRRRPARRPLTREAIERAALELVDEAGLDDFSMRKLGQRLNCEAMSLYHHFPSKAHLLDALVDRVIGGLRFPPRDGDPIERLRKICHRWREMALSHPGFFPHLAMHRLNSPVGVARIDDIMFTMRRTGLTPEAAARLFRVLGYYLNGAALEEIYGYRRGPSSMNPVDDEALARDHPDIAQAGPYFAPDQFRKTFEAGLEVLLEGIRRAAAPNPRD